MQGQPRSGTGCCQTSQGLEGRGDTWRSRGHHPGAEQGAGGLREGGIPTKGDPGGWGVRSSPGQVFEGQSERPRRETQLWTQRPGFEFCSAIFSATFSSLLNTSLPQSPLL